MVESAITINATDMPESMQEEVKKIATKVFGECLPEKDLAHSLKKEIEKTQGRGWCCVVGKNFGSHICPRTNRFIFFSFKEIYVLLWRA
mmetsp:Transcript_70313/g.81952  ORF Transcript_70313/g.81952 Transcript_70313/m.81952 type:complete len:89 (+) Transcript_70313:48-314(+)